MHTIGLADYRGATPWGRLLAAARRLAAGLLWSLAVSASAACEAVGPSGPPPAPVGGAELERQQATLRLLAADAAATADELAVDLLYTRHAEQAAPRLMELRVRYDPGVLAFVGSTALSAAVTAGKQVIVQERGGVLRTVMLATDNLAAIETGPLVRYRFRRLNEEATTVTLDSEMPIFAPLEANTGVLLAPPLMIQGRLP